MVRRAPETLDAAIEWLRKHFDPDAARGLSATYQIELSGPEGGCLVVRVRDGALDLVRGTDGDAQVIFRVAASDYYALLAGRENADLLYMDGRLEIEGELSRAMKLRTLFRAPA